MDFVLPFLLENGLIRGSFVQADTVCDEIIQIHSDYPKMVKELLKQSVVLGLFLANTIKYDGSFVLQFKGTGPIKKILVDISSALQVRAYADFDEENLPETMPDTVLALFGKGSIVFSVSFVGKEPYQGVITMEEPTLIANILNYFHLSEQIDTDIVLLEKDGNYRGIFIQKMPAFPNVSKEEQADIFETVSILMHSVRKEELFSSSLFAEELLYRLFHGNRLQVFDKKEIEAFCPCHRDRMHFFLQGLPKQSLESLFQDDKITAYCEYCKKEYVFTKQDFK